MLGKLVAEKYEHLKNFPYSDKKYHHEKLVEHRTAIQDLKKDYDKFGNLLDHPLFGIGITSTGEIVQTEIEEILVRSDELFELTMERLSDIENKLNINIDDFNTLESYLKLFEVFKQSPELSTELYDQENIQDCKSKFDDVLPHIYKVNEIESKTLNDYEPSVLDLEVEKIKTELDSRYSSFFRFLKPSYYKFKKGINSHLKNGSGHHKSGVFDEFKYITELLNDLQERKVNQHKIDQAEEDHLKNMLGSLWLNKDTDIDKVQSCIAWKEQFESNTVNEKDKSKFKDYIFQGIDGFRIDSIGDELKDLALEQLLPAVKKLNEKAKIDDLFSTNRNK